MLVNVLQSKRQILKSMIKQTKYTPCRTVPLQIELFVNLFAEKKIF